MKRSLSVIVPVYNEEENIKPLYKEIKNSAELSIKRGLIEDYEIVFVNDGSVDKTQENLEDIKKKEIKLRIIELRKNFGQTAGLRAGFKIAKGDLIVTMDGDMQNDPADIPFLINKIDEGYDVVSGWRAERKDRFGKRVSSRVMNFLRRKLIGDELHDYGCSLKIYKKDCMKDLELFGELHRYITAYLYIKGYKIGEIKVNHRQRFRGKTKYGFSRGINGFLDLLYLKFWASYSDRPLHLFGRFGIYQIIPAGIIVIEQVIKALVVKGLYLGPLLVFASMLVITGILFIMFGFLSEINSRNYYKDKEYSSIKKTL